MYSRCLIFHKRLTCLFVDWPQKAQNISSDVIFTCLSFTFSVKNYQQDAKYLFHSLKVEATPEKRYLYFIILASRAYILTDLLFSKQKNVKFKNKEGEFPLNCPRRSMQTFLRLHLLHIWPEQSCSSVKWMMSHLQRKPSISVVLSCLSHSG